MALLPIQHSSPSGKGHGNRKYNPYRVKNSSGRSGGNNFVLKALAILSLVTVWQMGIFRSSYSVDYTKNAAQDKAYSEKEYSETHPTYPATESDSEDFPNNSYGIRQYSSSEDGEGGSSTASPDESADDIFGVMDRGPGSPSSSISSDGTMGGSLEATPVGSLVGTSDGTSDGTSADDTADGSLTSGTVSPSSSISSVTTATATARSSTDGKNYTSGSDEEEDLDDDDDAEGDDSNDIDEDEDRNEDEDEGEDEGAGGGENNDINNEDDDDEDVDGDENDDIDEEDEDEEDADGEKNNDIEGDGNEDAGGDENNDIDENEAEDEDENAVVDESTDVDENDDEDDVDKGVEEDDTNDGDDGDEDQDQDRENVVEVDEGGDTVMDEEDIYENKSNDTEEDEVDDNETEDSDEDTNSTVDEDNEDEEEEEKEKGADDEEKGTEKDEEKATEKEEGEDTRKAAEKSKEKDKEKEKKDEKDKGNGTEKLTEKPKDEGKKKEKDKEKAEEKEKDKEMENLSPEDQQYALWKATKDEFDATDSWKHNSTFTKVDRDVYQQLVQKAQVSIESVVEDVYTDCELYILPALKDSSTSKTRIKFKCLDGDNPVVQDDPCHTVNMCRVVMDKEEWKEELSSVSSEKATMNNNENKKSALLMIVDSIEYLTGRQTFDATLNKASYAYRSDRPFYIWIGNLSQTELDRREIESIQAAFGAKCATKEIENSMHYYKPIAFLVLFDILSPLSPNKASIFYLDADTDFTLTAFKLIDNDKFNGSRNSEDPIGHLGPESYLDLSPQASLVGTQNSKGKMLMNSSVLVVRNTRWSRDFMTIWWHARCGSKDQLAMWLVLYATFSAWSARPTQFAYPEQIFFEYGTASNKLFMHFRKYAHELQRSWKSAVRKKDEDAYNYPIPTNIESYNGGDIIGPKLSVPIELPHVLILPASKSISYNKTIEDIAEDGASSTVQIDLPRFKSEEDISLVSHSKSLSSCSDGRCWPYDKKEWMK